MDTALGNAQPQTPLPSLPSSSAASLHLGMVSFALEQERFSPSVTAGKEFPLPLRVALSICTDGSKMFGIKAKYVLLIFTCSKYFWENSVLIWILGKAGNNFYVGILCMMGV